MVSLICIDLDGRETITDRWLRSQRTQALAALAAMRAAAPDYLWLLR